MKKDFHEHKPMRDLLKTIREMRPNAVVFKLADRFTIGVPDMCVTELGITSFWEVKLADPDFDSMGLQEFNALRLAKHGICYYIIYEKADLSPEMVYIVHPQQLKNWKTQAISAQKGFNHIWVCNFIVEKHMSYALSLRRS